MKDLGMLMYDRSSPPGPEGSEWVENKIMDLEKSIRRKKSSGNI